MKAVVSQALSRLVSLGTSVPSAMVVAGALLAVLAGSGSQAQAQSRARPAAQAAKPSRYQAWTQVKEYNVHYEASYSTPFSIAWDWHGSVHDYTPNMRATADGKIKMVMSNSRYTTWEGNLDITGNYAMDVNWYTPMDTLEVDHARGQGPDRSGLGMYFAMTIDSETGTYDMVAWDYHVAGQVESHYQGGGVDTWYHDLVIPCPVPQSTALPADRPPLLFNSTIGVEAETHWMLADPYVADMRVDFSVTPVGPKPEFLLQPPPTRWIPEPDGTVAVKVVPKRADQAPAPVRFILEQITGEPGTCLNSQETDTAPDLDFDALANAGYFDDVEVVGPDSLRIETDEPVTSSKVTVRARDYGAWAKLRAEAQVDGAWQPIPVQGSSLGYVTLPFDKDENRIADEWEKHVPVRGKAPSWDGETKPKLDNTRGDGISLYEEYRGLIVQGKHQRLDPLTKELFVENRAGAPVKSGLKLLATASKLKVIELNPGELRDNRVVNFNSTIGRTRDQYGLRLTNAALEQGTMGQALPVDQTNKRPKECTEVQIDLAQLQGSPSGYDIKAEIDNTVAHELAHGIGASHHGEAGAPLIDRFLTEREVAPMHIVYGSDGKEIADRPFQIKGTIGGLHSMASGDTGCIMCYTSFYQWAVQRNEKGQYRYYAQQYRKPGRKFCTSAKGTGVNAKDNKPAPYFGDAERGNCLAQLSPRDR